MLRGQINVFFLEHPIIAIWNNRNENDRRICKTVYRIEEDLYHPPFRPTYPEEFELLLIVPANSSVEEKPQYSTNLWKQLLFCSPTWPSHHVSENQE